MESELTLSTAMRLSDRARLALVGSGGKTSALFQIAREMLAASPAADGRVLLSASTHLATAQLALADRHYMIESLDQAPDRRADLPPGVLLFTGPETQGERTRGLEVDVLERLRNLADFQGLPFLLEADGSRQRPLKAPAAHEPVIPAWAETVGVVVGLSGLGKPLEEAWVHRPERFSALTGLPLGQEITVEAVRRLLLHPEGGLKGVPIEARRVALLNQADTPELQAAAGKLAADLIPDYQAAVIASLKPADGGQPVVYAVHERVAGVLLAAGGSQRLGRPKQMLEWRGEPLVRHVARATLSAGLSPLIVVTGGYRQQVEAALQDLPLTLVYNPNWQSGQSASLQAGLRRLPPQTGGVIFLLSDQPQVPVPLLRSLVELHQRSLSPLVAPQAGGRRANPVLFDRVTFPDLFALRGDQGGRALFTHYPAAWLPWHDPNLLLDIDTEEDYRRLLALEAP